MSDHYAQELETFERRLEELELEAELAGDGYHVDDDGWEHHRFTLTLKHAGATIYEGGYRQGMGHDTDPTSSHAIAALLSDAGAVRDRDEEEFLEELGYLETGRGALRGLKAYRACCETLEALEGALGRETVLELEELAQEAGR